MLHKRILEQMLDFHRTTLENSFSITTMLQCQAENILNFFRHYSGMNDEAKKVMDKRIREYKKGIDDLKKAIDDGYTQIETLLDLDAVFLSQDQTEKMLSTFICQQNLVPQNYLKDVMKEWISLYNKNMKNIGDLLPDSHQTKAKARQKN
jgi:adenylate kinase family enzyme